MCEHLRLDKEFDDVFFFNFKSDQKSHRVLFIFYIDNLNLAHLNPKRFFPLVFPPRSPPHQYFFLVLLRLSYSFLGLLSSGFFLQRLFHRSYFHSGIFNHGFLKTRLWKYITRFVRIFWHQDQSIHKKKSLWLQAALHQYQFQRLTIFVAFLSVVYL